MIYRNLLESINDIVPRIPLVTVMQHVSRDCEDVHLRGEMRCEEIVFSHKHLSSPTNTEGIQ